MGEANGGGLGCTSPAKCRARRTEQSAALSAPEAGPEQCYCHSHTSEPQREKNPRCFAERFHDSGWGIRDRRAKLNPVPHRPPPPPACGWGDSYHHGRGVGPTGAAARSEGGGGGKRAAGEGLAAMRGVWLQPCVYMGGERCVYRCMCKRWCWPFDVEPCFQLRHPAGDTPQSSPDAPQASTGRSRDKPTPLHLNPVLLPQNTGPFVLLSLLAWHCPPLLAQLSGVGHTSASPLLGSKAVRPLFASTPFAFPLGKWSHQETFNPSLPLYSFCRILRQLAQGEKVALCTTLCVNHNYSSLGLQWYQKAQA